MKDSDKYFSVEMLDGNPRQVVVIHRVTGQTARADLEPDVPRLVTRLRREILASVLGTPEGIRLSVGRGEDGDIVFAEHLPSGTRTRSHRRADLPANYGEHLVEELFVLLAGVQGSGGGQ